jgi:hypothetical protein
MSAVTVAERRHILRELVHMTAAILRVSSSTDLGITTAVSDH